MLILFTGSVSYSPVLTTCSFWVKVETTSLTPETQTYIRSVSSIAQLYTILTTTMWSTSAATMCWKRSLSPSHLLLFPVPTILIFSRVKFRKKLLTEWEMLLFTQSTSLKILLCFQPQLLWLYTSSGSSTFSLSAVSMFWSILPSPKMCTLTFLSFLTAWMEAFYNLWEFSINSNQ